MPDRREKNTCLKGNWNLDFLLVWQMKTNKKKKTISQLKKNFIYKLFCKLCTNSIQKELFTNLNKCKTVQYTRMLHKLSYTCELPV